MAAIPCYFHWHDYATPFSLPADGVMGGQLTLAMVDAAGVDVHAPAVQAAARTCLPAADGAITAAQVYRAENGAGAGG